MATKRRKLRTYGGFKIGDLVRLTLPYEVELPLHGAGEFSEAVTKIGPDTPGTIIAFPRLPEEKAPQGITVRLETGNVVRVSLDCVEKIKDKYVSLHRFRDF